MAMPAATTPVQMALFNAAVTSRSRGEAKKAKMKPPAPIRISSSALQRTLDAPMKALDLIVAATTAAPRRLAPVSFEHPRAGAGKTVASAAPEDMVDDANEVLRDAAEEPAAETEAGVAAAAVGVTAAAAAVKVMALSRSAEEVLLRAPIEYVGPEVSAGNLTLSNIAGLATLRIKPESESMTHFWFWLKGFRFDKINEDV